MTSTRSPELAGAVAPAGDPPRRVSVPEQRGEPERPPNAPLLMQQLRQSLEATQWWPPERLREQQRRRLEALLRHAWTTVPLQRERLGRAGYRPDVPLDWETWRGLPIIRRAEIRQAGAALNSTRLPAAHGGLGEVGTSGSTGIPIRVRSTGLANLYYRAFTYRLHSWHRRDWSGKLAHIRRMSPGVGVYPGDILPRWGSALSFPFPTGPLVRLSIGSSIAQQAEWLAHHDPDYLLTYPSNLMALAAHCREHGIRLSRLRDVSTMAEVCGPEVREACRAVWDVPVYDVYSASEVGYIAIQCPAHEGRLHLQSEAVMVEIMRADGLPCEPGEVGEIVATPLWNFATPLLRYAIGDYAEVGETCDCGRGLPVLKRILGRTRNMLVTPTGERYWPFFGVRRVAELAPVVQVQFVQPRLDLIQARLVVARPPTEQEEAALKQHILSKLPYPFTVELVYCTALERSAGGKFEDFVSKVAEAPPS